MAENGLGTITGSSSPFIQKFPHEGSPYATEDVGGLQNALKVSSEVEVTLAYASEKLVNLETLLLHVLGGDHDVGSTGLENDIVSPELIEKCFTIDLLHSMLSFELRELDSLLCDIQELIVDALQKISSYDQPTEILNLVSKFHDSEELLKQLQERILEIKIQLTKLQMTSFSFKQNEWKQDLISRVNELPLAGTEGKPQMHKVEQRRIIRMLEKSLERELELEKSLAELKQNEQDHNVKIRLVEQVSACMEEAAEVAWARFLEADNRAEVLMGISKEMLGKFQIFQFSESGTANREEEIKCKLQDCLIKLAEKDTSIQNLKSNISQLIKDNAELKSLKEKAQILEKKLHVTESRLKEENVEAEKSQQQVKEMEIEMESLRENIYAAESRARTVEEKNTHLNESNMELTEELEFLKGSNDSNSKKVSVLEKQIRDLDLHLQNARVSSEASQEQQNMLYSAIWDMETLIDELKQKVATSESKTENVEERCLMLSETNSELNKELNILRSRLKFMESSLNQVAIERKSSANDISLKAGIIMDTVVQLAKERERIQKQLNYLTKENTLLREKTKMDKRSECTFVEKNIGDEKVLQATAVNLQETENGEDSLLIANEIASESCQVELLNNASVDQKEKSSASHSANLVPELDVESRVETGKTWRKYMLMTILVLLFAVLAAHLFNDTPPV